MFALNPTALDVLTLAGALIAGLRQVLLVDPPASETPIVAVAVWLGKGVRIDCGSPLAGDETAPRKVLGGPPLAENSIAATTSQSKSCET
jgi:hypothetical protein